MRQGFFVLRLPIFFDFIIANRAGDNNVLVCLEIFLILFGNFFFVVLIVLFLRFLVIFPTSMMSISTLFSTFGTA